MDRREIAQDSDGGVAEPLVFVEVSADKHEVGTELPRAPSRHAASYAEGPRFVGGRENDAAADRNRLAAQARVEQLFDRRIKGVEVRVENGGCGTHLVDSSPRSTATRATPATLARTPGSRPHHDVSGLRESGVTGRAPPRQFYHIRFLFALTGGIRCN